MNTHPSPRTVRIALALAAGFSFVASSTALAADAAENWSKHCAACHGKDGKGQTKAGKMAGAKDMTDAAYQAGLKDEKMFSSIKDGTKDKSGKDVMKPFAAKLSDDEIKALVARVRAFKP